MAEQDPYAATAVQDPYAATAVQAAPPTKKPDEKPTTPAPAPGLIARGWAALNRPIGEHSKSYQTEEEKLGKLTKPTTTLAEAEERGKHPISSAVKSFIAGMEQDLGSVLTPAFVATGLAGPAAEAVTAFAPEAAAAVAGTKAFRAGSRVAKAAIPTAMVGQGGSQAVEGVTAKDMTPEERIKAVGGGLASIVGGAAGMGDAAKTGRERLLELGQKLTGTGPSLTREKVGGAAEKAQAVAEARPEVIKDWAKEVIKAKKSNVETGTKNKQGIVPEQNMQDRKAALQAGHEALATTVGEQIKALDKSVRGEANGKYATVRAKIGDASAQPEVMADYVRKASAKLKGSEENIKVFRDILRRVPEGEQYVVSGGSKFGPGSAPFEAVLKSEGPNSPAIEGGSADAGPMPFGDLQGYYTELGEEMAKGTLPGDVYQAIKSLRDDIGKEMHTIAKSNGADKDLKEAQSFYHDYMDTFHEPAGPSGSGSPVAQALRAKDPAQFAKPFSGDAGNRGIESLARYSPELAEKTNNLRRIGREIDSIGAPTKPKAIPEKPEQAKAPVVDVQAEKTKQIEKMAKQWGTFNARDIGILSSSIIARPLLRLLGGGAGFGEAIAGAAASYEGGKLAASKVLEKPAIIKFLSQPTAADMRVIEKIPGADRVKIINGFTDAAVESGHSGRKVKLSPAISRFLGVANVAKILAANNSPAIQGNGPKKDRQALINSAGQTAGQPASTQQQGETPAPVNQPPADEDEEITTEGDIPQ